MNQKPTYPRFRRKCYFINKSFQTRFILKFCILVVIGCIIFGVSLYLFSKPTVTTSFENSRLVLKSTADFILPALVSTTIIVIIVTGIACIIVVLFISHKIAGPMYRFEKSTETIGAGDFTLVVRLRSHDELKALAKDFNDMIEKLRAHTVEIKELNNMLKDDIGDLNKIQGNYPEEEKVKLIEKIVKRQEELNKALTYFKT